MPIVQIAANMKIQQTICNGAPFYFLGPLVTDIAPGYEQIISAIGGSIAASAGEVLQKFMNYHTKLAIDGDLKSTQASLCVILFMIVIKAMIFSSLSMTLVILCFLMFFVSKDNSHI